MKQTRLTILALSLLCIPVGMAEPPRTIGAAERLEALVDSITAIPDFKPEPERTGPDGLPLPSRSVLARGKDVKAVSEYYTEAGSKAISLCLYSTIISLSLLLRRGSAERPPNPPEIPSHEKEEANRR